MNSTNLSKDAARLKEQLRELFRERCTKTELLQHVVSKLREFPHLKSTLFQYRINEFIVKCAEDDCEILLHDEDMSDIWS